MQAFKERTNKECFSLISAELYFDSCRHDTMLTFKEGRRGHVASLLLSPLLTRNFKNTYLSTDFVTRCCNVTVLIKPVETATRSNINSKSPHDVVEMDRMSRVHDGLESDESHMSMWTC